MTVGVALRDDSEESILHKKSKNMGISGPSKTTNDQHCVTEQ